MMTFQIYGKSCHTIDVPNHQPDNVYSWENHMGITKHKLLLGIVYDYVYHIILGKL